MIAVEYEILGLALTFENLELIFIALSIPFLLVGTFLKMKYRHIFMAIADALFAASWLFLIPHYYEMPDWINVLLVIGAALLFGYLAFHEVLNFLFDEDLAAMDWLAHVGVSTTGVYFIVSKVEILSSGLIWFVVSLSVGILQIFGYDVDVGASAATTCPGGVCYPVEAGFSHPNTPISIVLACTGIQASLLLLTSIAFTKPNRGLWEKWADRMRGEYSTKHQSAGPFMSYFWRWRYRQVRRLQERAGWMRKIISILLVVPAVFIANLFRNSAVIYVVYEGIMSFELSHNIIAKFYAGAVLVVLVLIVFDHMPEVQENVMTLKDMLFRIKPGMVENGYIKIEDKTKDEEDKEEEPEEEAEPVEKPKKASRKKSSSKKKGKKKPSSK